MEELLRTVNLTKSYRKRKVGDGGILQIDTGATEG